MYIQYFYIHMYRLYIYWCNIGNPWADYRWWNMIIPCFFFRTKTETESQQSEASDEELQHTPPPRSPRARRNATHTQERSRWLPETLCRHWWWMWLRVETWALQHFNDYSRTLLSPRSLCLKFKILNSERKHLRLFCFFYNWCTLLNSSCTGPFE